MDAVLDKIDPERKFFKFVIPRKHCIKFEDFYIKPLQVINRDLSRMVIIDNSSICFCKDLDNGIPIVSFFDNKTDLELLMLLGYLEQLENVADVREFNRKHLKLYKYSRYKDLKSVYDGLFD